MYGLPGSFISSHRSDGLWPSSFAKKWLCSPKIVSSIYNIAPMGNYGPIYEGVTNIIFNYKSGHRL
jgi:hypothetical protein